CEDVPAERRDVVVIEVPPFPKRHRRSNERTEDVAGRGLIEDCAADGAIGPVKLRERSVFGEADRLLDVVREGRLHARVGVDEDAAVEDAKTVHPGMNVAPVGFVNGRGGEDELPALRVDEVDRTATHDDVAARLRVRRSEDATALIEGVGEELAVCHPGFPSPAEVDREWEGARSALGRDEQLVNGLAAKVRGAPLDFPGSLWGLDRDMAAVAD